MLVKMEGSGASGGSYQMIDVTLTSDPQTIQLDFEPSFIFAKNKVGFANTGYMESYYISGVGAKSIRKGSTAWSAENPATHGIINISGKTFQWSCEPNTGTAGGLEYIAVP